MIRKLALLLSLVSAIPAFAQGQSSSPAMPPALQSLTPEQQDAVRALVRQTIMEHPEIIMEAVQALEAREQAAGDARAGAAIAASKAALEQDPADPVAGDPKGDVALVQFFDYRCPYCKAVSDRAFSAAKADGRTRLVFKEFPILGPQSVVAARAALAARQQGKYVEMHKALMAYKGTIDENSVADIARKQGMDPARLARDMKAPEVDTLLQKNLALAKSLGVTGTPAFVVGGKLIPGAVEEDALRSAINGARKG